MTWTLPALFIAGAVALSSCGGGGGDTSSTATSVAIVPSTVAPSTVAPSTVDTTVSASAPASASFIVQGVEVKVGEGEYTAISDATSVEAGDRVRTDAAGFAEISYPDQSITRLDVDTEFELVSMTESSGVTTTLTKLNSGRVWNRVQSLGSEGEFLVETPVATANVRGTGFLVECREVGWCTFTVLDGTIDIEIYGMEPFTLEAPRSVGVAPDGHRTPLLLPFDEAFVDPWVVDNAARDVAVGFRSSVEIYEEFGPLFGSLSGTFDGERTIDSVECLEAPTCSFQDLVGDVAPRTFTFSIDCTDGYPCVGQALPEYTNAGEVVQTKVPMLFDGATFTWSVVANVHECSSDDGGVFGRVDYVIDWTLTPTAAEIRGDKYVVTDVALAIVVVNTVTTSAPECDSLDGGSHSQIATATATRTA